MCYCIFSQFNHNCIYIPISRRASSLIKSITHGGSNVSCILTGEYPALTTASWSNANYDGAISSSFGGTGLSAAYLLGTMVTTSLDDDFDKEAVRSFTLFNGAGTDVTLPAYTRLNGPNIEFLILLDKKLKTFLDSLIVTWFFFSL